MSYEIIYKLFTIRKENKFIPFVVMGSNNCWETYPKNRRERNLHKAYFFFKDKRKEFNSIEEIKNNFDFNLVKTDIENGNIQGRFKSAKSVLKRLITKIIDYKDLNLIPELYSLYYFKATNKEKEQIQKAFEEENIKEILTTEEEEEFIKDFKRVN